jgi:hypothetical protein
MYVNNHVDTLDDQSRSAKNELCRQPLMADILCSAKSGSDCVQNDLLA